ncbi:MAG: hypothetical protein GQ525_07805 [Draconibacterium sp.]|nr:hypothetical protein [Draconibacterium sp.]
MKKTITLLLAIIFAFNIAVAQNNESTKVRILTFNILHGATTNGDFDLDKIASVILETNPDLVALQEVDFKTNRAKNYDLATELGWRTKMTSLFGIAMPFDGGGYGEGVLTKMPIIASRNVPLPHSPNNEPRTALEVTVQLESGDTICFVGTHLEHQRNNPDRIDQTKEINEIFLSNKYPTILAGDLNDTPESEAILILKKYWIDTFGENPKPTYSSDNPRKKIDYIFYMPANKWKVVENKIICDTIASDHCAVLSVLELLK